MYDVLVYVYEHCQQGEIAQDRARIARKLAAAGFDHSDVDQALHWLDGMRRRPQATARPLPDAAGSFRAYSPREAAKLDAGCLGLLITLERSAILSPEAREVVLDRALAATGDQVTVEQLKLIVLMVLWNSRLATSRLLAEELFHTPGRRLPS